MKSVHINATDIPDAWFQCIYNIFNDDVAYEYVIDRGSFEGNKRREFFYITVEIEQAYNEPYFLMLPQIPAHYNIPNPVADDYVEQYLPYLMTSHVSAGEAYTYGSRICFQIGHAIQELKETPKTNQVLLQIAEPSDRLLSDPPCLRHIDLRVLDGQLHFFPYFRSWDLWSGLPANLAGIAVLQKYMADEMKLQTGKIIASSKGLHIYQYVEELAKMRANK